MALEVYQRIAAMMPQSLNEKIRKELNYLDINLEAKNLIGFMVVFGLALSAGIALNLQLIFNIPFITAFPVIFLFLDGSIYLWLSVAAESKGQFVENILPDALQLIASNIKSGLTTERAIFLSARPEFGPLEVELKRASQKIMAGEPVEQALSAIPEKIHSVALERTMWLISKGISSGGQIADLLVQLGDDLREQKGVEAETKANISMYVMLIFFSVAIGAPALFGVASFIVEVLAKQMAALPTIDPSTLAAGSTQFGKFRGITGLLGDRGEILTSEFIQLFSVVALIITSIFSAFTIGIINAGKEKQGLKYIPVLIAVTLILFFLTRAIIGSVFYGLAGS